MLSTRMNISMNRPITNAIIVKLSSNLKLIFILKVVKVKLEVDTFNNSNIKFDSDNLILIE